MGGFSPPVSNASRYSIRAAAHKEMRGQAPKPIDRADLPARRRFFEGAGVGLFPLPVILGSSLGRGSLPPSFGGFRVGCEYCARSCSLPSYSSGAPVLLGQLQLLAKRSRPLHRSSSSLRFM